MRSEEAIDVQEHAIGAALAIACAVPLTCYGQSRNELAEIRNQIQRIKDEYEARISTLEKRLAEAEARSAQAEQKASAAQTEAARLAFALSVTASVQLVGIYLVFASLIVPALAVRNVARGAMACAYAIGTLCYGIGIVSSAVFDLPTGPLIVWALAVFAMTFALAAGMRKASGLALVLTRTSD